MIRIAIIFSPPNPIQTATGRKMSGWITNLIRDAAIVGLIFASAFLPSNPAPIVISASGVAICATLLTVLLIIVGNSIPKSPTINPAKMPRMIGFLAIPIHASLIFCFPSTRLHFLPQRSARSRKKYYKAAPH